MAKAVKKVQQEIEGFEVSKLNMEEFSQQEIKEAEEWFEKLKKNTPTITVDEHRLSEVYEWYCDGSLIINHEYQRQKVWDNIREQGLLQTWVEGLPTPVLIVSEYAKNDKIIMELIDGQQRILTADDWYNNKLPLPSFVPRYYGGQKTIEHTRDEIKQRIDTARLYVMKVRAKDVDQIKEIYIRLQQGMVLKIGEIVLGLKGNARDLIVGSTNHKLFDLIVESNKREQYIAVATYIYVMCCASLNQDPFPYASFPKQNVEKRVRMHMNQNIKTIEQEMRRVMDTIYEYLVKHEKNKISYFDVILLIDTMLTLEKRGTKKEHISIGLLPSYNIFRENCEKLLQLDMLHKEGENIDIPSDLMRYYSVLNLQKSVTQGTSFSKRIPEIIIEFDKYLNQ